MQKVLAYLNKNKIQDYIVLTSSGYAAVNCQLVMKTMSEQYNLPIICIEDPDFCGFEAYLNMTFDTLTHTGVNDFIASRIAVWFEVTHLLAQKKQKRHIRKSLLDIRRMMIC